ncbi:MAG: CDP-alcohol phosphatidyltransferase family protein [Mogibacterium sp.]|nr:CDP-alcohol phosphatidyltransferase family protein [Mogibacterium sp.]
MLGVYNYTVILTYIGMLSGFAGITFAMQGNISMAVICLLISGVCDMFDGKIASTMERTSQEKRFGIQIDSLSDLICFGVLPAVMVVNYIENSVFTYAAASAYVLCALIRLAWFNVNEEERQDRESSRREYYLGLPVTLAAVILPVTYWAAEHFAWSDTVVYPSVLAMMSAAFLTPFKIRKPSLSKLGMLLFGGAGMLLLILSGMDV